MDQRGTFRRNWTSQMEQLNSSGPRDGQPVIRTLVPLLDGLILVSGLLGQILVITILTGRRRKTVRPTHGTDTLLLVLSAADLLLLLCLPFHTAAITLGFWPFGEFLCKCISFLGVACSSASVLTLAALAVTRYLTVVHPNWAYRSRMQRRVKLTVALVWVMSAALAAPQFAFRTVSGSSAVHCFAFLSSFGQLVYSIALFLFGFTLPLAVIVLMYVKIYCFLHHAGQLRDAPRLQRYQTQVTQTSALLVLVFTVLWLPSYVLMFSFIGQSVATSGYNLTAVLARLLASSVAVVNPVLYVFMSQKFRRDLLEVGRDHWTGCKSCVNKFHWGINRDPVLPFTVDTSSVRASLPV